MARADPATGTLTVHVTGALGQPVSGECVRLETPPSGSYDATSAVSTATSDQAGLVTFSVSGGSYVVDAHYCEQKPDPVAERFAGGDDRITTATIETVTAGATTDAGTITLPATGSITGTVTDEHGNPSPTSCVHTVDTSNTAQFFAGTGTRTTSAGTYTISGLYPRGHVVEFQDCSTSTPASYYNHVTSATQATPVAVTAGQTAPGIDGVVPVGASLTAHFLDSAGHPVTTELCFNYQVVPNGSYQQVDGVFTNGQYTLKHLAPGTYQIGAYSCDNSADHPNLLPAADQQVSVGTDQAAAGTLVLPPGGQVTGTVRDGAGNAVAGACVSWGGSDESTTAADGSYDIRPVPTAKISVEVVDCGRLADATSWYSHSFLQSQAALIPVTAGQVTGGVDLSLDTPQALLTGRVTDSDGNPVAGAIIAPSTQNDGFAEARSDSQGNYTVYGLPTVTNLRVTGLDGVNGSALLSTSVTTSVTSGQTTSLNLVLPRAGTIAGSVVDQRGLPVLGIRSQAVCPINGGGSQGVQGSVTDSQGRYSIAGVPPGIACTVTFFDADGQLPFEGYYGFPGAQTGVTVSPGGTASLPVQLVVTVQPPTAPTAVSVVTGDASAVLTWLPPASDGYAQVASYTVRNATGSVLGTTAASNRSLALSSLADGQSYTVSVTATNRKGTSPSATVTFTPRKGQPTALGSPVLKARLSLTVRRRGRSARVTVTDAGATRGRRLVLQGLKGRSWKTIDTLTETSSGRWSRELTARIPKPDTRIRLAVLIGTRTPTFTGAVRAV